MSKKNMNNDFKVLNLDIQDNKNIERTRKLTHEEQVKQENRRKQKLRFIRDFLNNEFGRSAIVKTWFLTGFAKEEFLHRVFDIFDEDDSGSLKQTDWIESLKVRLKGDRELDFAELVETLCYVLRGDADVDKITFVKIFSTVRVLDKLFSLVDRDSDGLVSAKDIMDFIAGLSKARPRFEINEENLKWLEEVFQQNAQNNEIRLEDFRKIVKSKNPFFAQRMFSIFDKDCSGAISLEEFKESMHQFAGQSPDEKLQFLFKVYDLDGDGLIQLTELQEVMKACMEENGMAFSEEQIKDLTSALFEDADINNTGAISFEALKAQIVRHDGLLENLSISIDSWLVPPKPPKKQSFFEKFWRMWPYQLSVMYLRNNYVYIIFLFQFIALNAVIVGLRVRQFWGTHWLYVLARAAGQGLNLTSMYILLFVLRGCVTFLRSRGFASYLPLDHHLYFHKLCGYVVLFYSVVHTVAHLINFPLNVVTNPEINTGNWTTAEFLFTAKPGLFGLIGGWANPTGVLLFITLIIMVLCSLPVVRKSGYFEVFYFSHLLYIVYWGLLIFHGPNFWKWFIVPFLIFVVEKSLRFLKMRTGRGKTNIISGILLPSKVTHLVIRRPPSFEFSPGDYVFVNIPAIAKFEWHPFTISSAPEQQESMWLHVRAVGQWTNKLYDYFQEVENQLVNLDNSTVINIEKSNDLELKSKNGISNPAYSGDEKLPITEDKSSDKDQISREKPGPPPTVTVIPNHNGRHNGKKIVKTLSLPDFQHRMKKRERLLAIRNLERSTSARQFDNRMLRQRKGGSMAGVQALQQYAYSSPGSASLARSFRYMRRMPFIISLEQPQRSMSSQEEEPTDLQTHPAEISPADLPLGKPLEIYVDGPYGAPASHMFRAEHAVLIGTGIGVTPFASILQSIMHKHWQSKHVCPKCSHQWVDQFENALIGVKKVDFFWINRDQRSFEWFVNLLSQLEIEQAEMDGSMDRFLTMHMYITSALQKTDMKALGLQLALDLLHEKEKRDLITGLKTRTMAGRPNWSKVFKQIADMKKGRVTVFYCGPPQLGRVLRYKCDEFGFIFRKENF